ncbi:MAG TPA: hypothetical protein VLZ50_02205 [Terracidiphilus sp.]|nr:hypothetical protein [Terracidiphilus sp.]
MISRRSILFFALCAAAALPAVAASGRYAITSGQVAAVVSNDGFPVSAGQVTLPAQIVASVPDPVLKVKSIDRTGEGRAVARVECAIAQQCLPFIATLAFDTRLTTGPVPLSSLGRIPALPQQPSPALVRAGTPATLLLEGTHVHITLPVVCLESGAMGQTIRARSPDHRQVYTVQVVREGVLEGRL